MRLFVLALVPLLAACQLDASAGTEAPPAPEIADASVEAVTLPAQLVSDAPTMTVYKSPTCGCCAMWVEHMEAAGFEVVTVDRDDMGTVKDSLGVPRDLSSCHTATVGDYVVEGHVPAEHVARLLDEAPEARGLAVPGMPIGSPGMEMGDRRDPYDVLIMDADGEAAVFANVPGNAAP